MIEVEGLRKTFYTPEPVEAVGGVSFTCKPGEVFGLLGPNGAGKTTTLRMLVTLLSPDGGKATLMGHDVVKEPEAVRGSVGYLSCSTGLYGRLTARELLLYFAELQGVKNPEPRVDELIRRFEITPFKDLPCDKLSTGMKQKVNIARAIVHAPPILIFDEPTNGLDVLVSQTILSFIEEAKAEGHCILFSTHIMSEAERLCDRLAIIHQGQILAEGTLAELREQSGEHYLEQVFVHFVEAGA